MREMLNRIQALFRRRAMDDDLAREMEFHIAMKSEQTGDPAAARRAVGSPLHWRERGRDVWGWTFLDEFFRDLRYGVRSLRRNRTFAVAAIVTLGLGIGATTLIFSVIDITVLRSFPFPEPDRLAIVWSTTSSSPRNRFTPEVYQQIRDNGAVELGGASATQVTLTAEPYPERLPANLVTGSYLAVLGVRPVIGRNLTEADEAAAAPDVIMITERIWRSRFRGDPAVIGQRLAVRLMDRTAFYSIVGVIPDALHSVTILPRELWLPLKQSHQGRMEIVGRVGPGVTFEAAQNALKTAIAGLNLPLDRGERPATTMLPMVEYLTQESAKSMRLLAVAVSLVLLIACASVANLMLARGAERTHELSVRVAIGAAKARLFRQLLTESVVLGMAGGILGAAVAYASIGFVKELVPREIYRREWVAVDARVLAFTAAISILCGIVFGLLPAWRASRSGLRPILARVPGGGRERTWLRSALIVGEVALALVLVSGASLLLKSYWKLATKDLGFNRAALLTLNTDLPPDAAKDPDVRIALEREIERRLASIPGVRSVGLSDVRPLGSMSINLLIRNTEDQSTMAMAWSAVSPGFFQAMEISLRRGRGFTLADTVGAAEVVVINEAAARKYWPGRDPIGRQLEFGIRTKKVRRIIGVVGDTAGVMLESDPVPMVYVPRHQEIVATVLDVVLRLEPGATTAETAPAIRRELAAVDSMMAVNGTPSMAGQIAERMARPRFFATLLTAFAFLALVLTVTAVAGVAAYLVRARTYEFGVRMALGAAPRQILALILRYGGTLALLGIVLGAIGSIALSKTLKAYLFQVQSDAPFALSAAPLLLLLAVLLACYFPARRAMRINPAQSLRHD